MNTYLQDKKSRSLSVSLGILAAVTLCCALAVFLVMRPFIAPEAVEKALSGCVTRLIPALFPFICISAILVHAGFGDICGRVIGRQFSAVTGLHPNGASAYILGAFCGFPIGGRTALSVSEDCSLDENETLLLCVLCNNPGVGFVICGIGAGLLGSVKSGVLLYLTNLFSVFSVAVLGRIMMRLPRKKHHSIAPENKKPEKFQVLSSISESIGEASVSMLKICGFVVFFTVLSNVLCRAFETFPKSGFLTAIIPCILEITAGAEAAVGNPFGIPLLFFTVGFGGMSAVMQLVSFSGERLSAWKYILLKLVQGIICSLIGGFLM